MAEHEIWLHCADHIDEFVFVDAGQFQWIIAQIKELDVVDIKGFGGVLGFNTPSGFNAVQGHAVLFPKFRAFAALTIRQTHDCHVISLLLMYCDGPAAAPDKIGGMGGNHKGGFLIRHGKLP